MKHLIGGKMMKKILASLIIAVIACVALTACGGGEGTGGQAPSGTAINQGPSAGDGSADTAPERNGSRRNRTGDGYRKGNGITDGSKKDIPCEVQRENQP